MGKTNKRHERQARDHGRSLNGVSYHGAAKSDCSSGKWGWSERAGAKTLLKVLRKNGAEGLRVYLCTECHRYHVGHTPKVVRRGRLAARDIYDNEPRSTS